MPLAANPLIEVLPGLMIWTIICFLIALYVLKKFAFGPIRDRIDARREAVETWIAETQQSREEAEKLLAEHKALLDQARVQGEEIVTDARKVADSMAERVKAEVEADRQRRLDDAAKQIAAETDRAIGRIRTEVADLTMAATTKVTGKVLDSADHKRLIEEAVADLDFSAFQEASK